MRLHGPIEAMMRPGFYPHRCAKVELLQTMTAWLLFAGELVYKVKKPVRLSFIDAATPAKRYRLCHDEALLNQRLAPEIYIGVAGVAEQDGSYFLVPNATTSQGNMREFAVVMRRLP
ncbi:MAG: adenylyl-sulfate kinase, partial [Deltaproteobacteria bacterium]|nr:adenylyl-sulfate kinase [Deltaproteobacteria bacterium]